MKIYDFDAKFYDYVRVQMAMQPALKEDEIEEKYNQMMQSWLNAPAQWLDGVKPIDYFKRYDDPKDLVKLFEAYMKRDIGLPEPLYTRIVEIGEPCAPALTRMAGDISLKENQRATAIALLRDMDSKLPVELYIDMVCASREMNELGEMACDSLKAMDVDLSDRLLARYDAAAPYARTMILDICAHGPGRAKVYDLLVDGLQILGLQHVGLVTLADKALGLQLIGQSLDSGLVQVQSGHLGTALGKSAGHGTADQTAGSGDHNQLTAVINIQGKIHN